MTEADNPESTLRTRRRRAAFHLGVIAIVFAIIALALSALLNRNAPRHDATLTVAAPTDTYDPAGLPRTIERRCVVCHGCYDAPCQFRMTSDEGVARGATKLPVYDSSRLSEAPLTRLGIDASSIDEWRKLDFFDVAASATDADRTQSILYRMLALGRAHPVSANAPLPDSIDLGITRDLTCPAPTEIDRYERDNPFGGMPYGVAPLADEEWSALAAWVGAGAPALLRQQATPNIAQAEISEWEKFLNGQSPKERLIARYFYEHLFLAHLYFPQREDAGYFNLVRSRTPPNEPVDIIATRRPYDDPGTDDFYYRLAPIEETILHKTHITYALGPDRLARYRVLFFNEEWNIDATPSYEPSVASNPFAAFAAIPARARYEFLLDDAEYFIRTFIRGPVCRGQVAVNVIEDRFWVMFLDPDADPAVTDADYLAAATPFLGLPAALADAPLPERLFPSYLEHHKTYEELRDSRYREADPENKGPAVDDIWLGETGRGPALLTIFRHFDNATVVGGFVGAAPETAWVIDFPTLERIYYNLVAGFDVFGAVEHQIATRVYMDLLRMESESLFLSFLPPDIRRPLHDSWYRGGHAKIRTLYHKPPIDIGRATQVPYATDDPKNEFLMSALTRDRSGVVKSDEINRHRNEGSGGAQHRAPLAALSSTQGPWVRFLPDLAYVRIVRADATDRMVSLIHDKEHTNVAFLFGENLRREPEKDAVTVVDGHIGSYPNLFFVISEYEEDEFIQNLKAVRNEKAWLDFVDAYGVRRSSPVFWATADFFQDVVMRGPASSGGLLDLNRYADP
ncbi:fatty acid cis/trans isomerase [Marinicaulis aureus]|uniref:Fatty acid cis/trans isomerase n=1 Tax=Hyphococcus aureus TaxID=2666033 RepID=A0ABW1L096_9PROT|nr:peptidylprolyl isomerase [Parvularcula sp.]